MKINQFTRLFFIVCFSVACGGRTTAETSIVTNEMDTPRFATPSAVDTFATGNVIARVLCQADNTQSYALYIPASGVKEMYPVVYFFDPHGDGTLPLYKYKALADAFGFILIGSNNSKNGNTWADAENIWAILSGDAQKRLKLDANRIYVCGFSGGAKVATYIALHHQAIKGVIANGAGLPEIVQQNYLPFSFTAITGEGDMNRSDLIDITNALDKTQTKHRIIFFDGIHEWAPESTMKTAFSGFQFDAMEKKTIAIDTFFISRYIAENKIAIERLTKANQLIRAAEMCKLSVGMLAGLTPSAQWFQEKYASLTANAAYKNQLKTEQDLLTEEEKVKEVFAQQFQQGDKNYWVKAIADLKIKAAIKNRETAMYQRLQAYLSLAFYSISNRMITSGNMNEAAYFVDLYKMADPTNSEAWYFSALLNARNNNADATTSDLLKAVANGFNDKNRLAQQPEFQQLGTRINLNEIISRMK